MKKNFFGGFIFPCCFALISISVSAYDGEVVSNENKDEQIPLLETTQFELIGTDSGLLQVTVKAANMRQYENRNLKLTGGIEIVIASDKASKEKGPIYVEANKLSYNEKEGICTIKGNVLVRKPEQQLQINTEQLWYDMNQEIIFTTLPIVVQHKEHLLKGTGLRATKDLTNYTITAPSGKADVKQEAILNGNPL